MIVRVLGEGQWRISENALPALNELDDVVAAAVTEKDQEKLTEALAKLSEYVTSNGEVVPDDEIVDSDLILPDLNSTVEEVAELLNATVEGLIPDQTAAEAEEEVIEDQANPNLD